MLPSGGPELMRGSGWVGQSRPWYKFRIFDSSEWRVLNSNPFRRRIKDGYPLQTEHSSPSALSLKRPLPYLWRIWKKGLLWYFVIWEVRWPNRNSYGYLIYHIYETVKLNQIKSNKFNYSESEKKYKAFIEHDLVRTLIAHHTFYDNGPLRDKRIGCTWDPPRGKRRLLYDCVWIVYVNQLCVNPASTLDESPRGSKFTTRNAADKLYLIHHLRFNSCLPVGCKSWKHKSFSDHGASLPFLL